MTKVSFISLKSFCSTFYSESNYTGTFIRFILTNRSNEFRLGCCCCSMCKRCNCVITLWKGLLEEGNKPRWNVLLPLSTVYCDKSQLSLKQKSLILFPIHISFLNLNVGMRREQIFAGRIMLSYLPVPFLPSGDDEIISFKKSSNAKRNVRNFSRDDMLQTLHECEDNSDGMLQTFHKCEDTSLYRLSNIPFKGISVKTKYVKHLGAHLRLSSKTFLTFLKCNIWHELNATWTQNHNVTGIILRTVSYKFQNLVVNVPSNINVYFMKSSWEEILNLYRYWRKNSY